MEGGSASAVSRLSWLCKAAEQPQTEVEKLLGRVCITTINDAMIDELNTLIDETPAFHVYHLIDHMHNCQSPNMPSVVAVEGLNACKR